MRVWLIVSLLLGCAFAAVPFEQAEAAAAKPAVTVTRANTGKVVLKKGAKYKLGATASKGKLKYSSSKPAVASVDKRGVIKAKRIGKSVVSVSALYGKKVAKKKITVRVVGKKAFRPVKKLSVSANSDKLVVGQAMALGVSFNPKSASNKNVTYKSSNKRVATVSAGGKVTAKKPGACRITVTSCGNAKAKATLDLTVESVTAKPRDTIVAKASSTNLTVGEYAKISAVLNSNRIKDPTVQMESSDVDKLMVKGDGRVFAATSGSATLTLSSKEDPSVKAELHFDIADNPYSVDADGDGLSDYMEETYLHTDPLVANPPESIPSMVVYAEDTVKVEDAQMDRVIELSVDDKRTIDQGDDEITVRLSSWDDDINVDDVVLFDATEDFETGLALKVKGVSSSDSGLVLTGVYPKPAEFIRFLSLNESAGSPIGTQDDSGTRYAEDFPDVELPAALHTSSDRLRFEKFDCELNAASSNVQLVAVPAVGDGNVLLGYDEMRYKSGDMDVTGVNNIAIKVGGSVSLEDLEGLFPMLRRSDSGISVLLEPVLITGLSVPEEHTGVYFDVILHAEADGYFRFGLQNGFKAGWHHEIFKGLKPLGQNSSYMSVQLAGQANLRAGVEADISVKAGNVAIVRGGIEFGMQGDLEAVQHFNPDMSCYDLSGAPFCEGYARVLTDLPEPFDTFDLGATVDFSEILDGMEIGGKLHYENGGVHVSECTWKPNTPEASLMIGAPVDGATFDGHTYEVYDIGVASWEEARAFCESHGGHLATLNSAEEDGFVYELVQKKGKSSAYFGYMRVDGTKPDDKEGWYWITGEPRGYDHWAPGEPNNQGGEEIYGMYYGSESWNDGAFEEDIKTFVCEWDYLPEGSNAALPADAVELDGNYYKIYADRKSWEEAKENCQGYSGHLATITSSREQIFLEQLNSSGRSLWLGGRRDDDNPDSKWRWVTGERWTYENWADGEPNNRSNENRLAMFPYEWNDLNENSSEQDGYVCEWEGSAFKVQFNKLQAAAIRS